MRKSILRSSSRRSFGEFSLSFSCQSFLCFHFDVSSKVREGGGNSGCPFTSRRVNQIIFRSSETDEEDADFLPGVALKPFLINRSQFGHLSLSPLDSVPPPQPPQYSHPRIVPAVFYHPTLSFLLPHFYYVLVFPSMTFDPSLIAEIVLSG